MLFRGLKIERCLRTKKIPFDKAILHATKRPLFISVTAQGKEKQLRILTTMVIKRCLYESVKRVCQLGGLSLTYSLLYLVDL